jgi:uncharacterized protein
MTMRNRVAFLVGALFGLGLFLSGMTDTVKVRGFLDFFGAWDPTLVFVIGGAIIPMAFAWAWTRGRAPLLGGLFPMCPDPQLDRRLILGSVLFGVGWGLAGLCPGPAMASLSWGGLNGALFFAAMAAAMWAAPAAARWLDAPAKRA